LALVVAPESMDEPSLQVMLKHVTEVVFVTALPQASSRVTLLSLHRYPFLLFRKATRIETLIELYRAERGVEPNIIMWFDSVEALKAMVKRAIGGAMLPLYTVDEDVRSGVLRRIRHKDKPLLMKIHLLGRRSAYTPPAVTAFIATATETL
jgi:DNA-binding transcriptional LysR family regulator